MKTMFAFTSLAVADELTDDRLGFAAASAGNRWVSSSRIMTSTAMSRQRAPGRSTSSNSVALPASMVSRDRFSSQRKPLISARVGRSRISTHALRLSVRSATGPS